MAKKRVLFAPLNWGIGHAIRSIPVLKELFANGFEIIIAGDGLPLEFLRSEFPDWQYLDLPSFRMRYSKGNLQIIPVLRALPEIIAVSWKEHAQLKRLIKEWNIDIVISDNRFGLFSKDCVSVYITHQLTIRMPAGFHFLEPVVRKLHRMVIAKYTYCWIPDEAGSINLSGNLSHNQALPKNTRFIGILSRFQKDTSLAIKPKQYDFLFLLSGAEPQRSILEEKIIFFFQRELDCKAMLIRGVSKQQRELNSSKQLTIINQVSGKELDLLLATSEIVVCRSGYTSIMELASISKRAVLVPTPGQSEQEYLGEYLSSRYPLFACIKQNDLTFSALLRATQTTKPYSIPISSGLLTQAIKDL